MNNGSKSKMWIGITAALAGAAALTLGVPRWLNGSADRSAPPIHHSRTNVLMLTLCTLRADHLGCYGYERDVSPNLDALAADGFRFERVLAMAPWTRAGVSAIITGMYPRSLNIEDPENHENYRRLHDDFTTVAEIMRGQGYYTIGVTANPNTHSVFNFHQGYDFYDDPDKLWQHKYTKDGVWTSPEVNRRFLQHLQTKEARGRKFFAHLVYIDVHTPREHKKETEPGDNFTVPPLKQRTMRDVYDLHVSFLDKNLGALFQELKAMELWDNTLILVNADHGEGLHDGGRILDDGHSQHVYNSTLWVPWIMHHPMLHTLRPTYEGMVRQIDMLPTLMDLLGIDPMQATAGVSKLAGVTRIDAMMSSAGSTSVDLSFVRTQFLGADKAAVVTADHKLILNFDREKNVKWRKDKKTGTYFHPPLFELYSYRSDEMTDLAFGEPSLVEELRGRYCEWEREFPPLVPDEAVRCDKQKVKKVMDDLRALGYVDEDLDLKAENEEVVMDPSVARIHSEVCGAALGDRK